MTTHPAAGRPPLDRALVSVVLPVFNEQLVLWRLHEGIVEALEPIGAALELIFVNDGSTDLTPLVLDELAQHDPRVRIVHFSRNFGHQAAVEAGLEHARGDAVVVMDSDLQDAPTALPRFLEAWQHGADVVYAVRTDRKEHPLKRLLFGAYYRVLAAISATRMPLDAGNFGLLDRRVAGEIVALGERDRYFPGLRAWVGFRQVGIEVERLARYDDRPRVSLRGLWRLAKTAVFSFSSFPLTVFYVIGYAALAVFVVLASYSLFCKLFTNLAIPGWTSHILSASFFGALNALGISILGEYVTRIYDQVRARPAYLVERRVNFGGPATHHETAHRAAATTAWNMAAAADCSARGGGGNDPIEDTIWQSVQTLEAIVAGPLAAADADPTLPMVASFVAHHDRSLAEHRALVD